MTNVKKGDKIHWDSHSTRGKVQGKVVETLTSSNGATVASPKLKVQSNDGRIQVVSPGAVNKD